MKTVNRSFVLIYIKFMSYLVALSFNQVWVVLPATYPPQAYGACDGNGRKGVFYESNLCSARDTGKIYETR